jgi:predicted transcriptional regulator
MAVEQRGVRTVVFLTPELKKQVKELAQREELNVSVITRRALRKYLEQPCQTSVTK